MYPWTQNPYRGFVESFSSTMKGLDLPLGNIAPPTDYTVKSHAPKVAILSPHPDDECVMGALALRLKRETGSAVVNIPVTFGSNPARKVERKEELANACKWIGFEIHDLEDGGLEKITPEARLQDTKHWEQAVSKLTRAIEQIEPDILFFPMPQTGIVLTWGCTCLHTIHLIELVPLA